MSEYDRELAEENWKTAVELYAINRSINDELERLQTENARLRAALEADKQKIEQLRETLLLIKVDGEVGQYDYWVYCPWCKEQGYSASIIHACDCQRQAALGLTEAQNG